MANVNTTQVGIYKKADAKELTDSKLVRGVIKSWSDSYVSATGVSLAVSDTITIGVIPNNSVFLGCKVYTSGFGTARTLSIGTKADPTKFSAARSVAAAGSIDANKIGEINSVYKSDEGVEVILTVGGGTISGTIKSQLMFATQ